MNREYIIEAWLMAGGKSTRMGQDKGLMPVRGQPMTGYLLKTLKELHLPAVIVTGNHQYHLFGVPVIPDLVANKGPLGGLHTALKSTTADYILLLSCDMPFISAKAIRRLLRLAGEADVVATRINGKINPLFALYHRSLGEVVEANVVRGSLKMQELIADTNHLILDMDGETGSELPEFVNLNTPGDVDMIESMNEADMFELKKKDTENSMIRVRLFGLVADETGCSSLNAPFTGDTEQLLAWIYTQYPKLEGIKFAIAVNKKMVSRLTPLESGDEVALLPPFSGG